MENNSLPYAVVTAHLQAHLGPHVLDLKSKIY